MASCRRKLERRDRGTCLYCSYKFSKNSNLRRHLRRNACGVREYIEAQRTAAPGAKVEKPTPSKYSNKAPRLKNGPEIPSEKEN
jgi:hypothetical protein